MTTDSTRPKLAVILHADVAGSTALVRADERLAHERIRDAFVRLCRSTSEYGGTPREIRGDAMLAEFQRASDGVCAALAFQHAHLQHLSSVTDPVRPAIRIGIALGEVVSADGTLTGAGVVLAQRLEQLAEPGGTCISGAVREALPDRLPLQFTSLGEHALKGFDDPVHAYAVAARHGAALPPPEAAGSGQRPAGRAPQWRRRLIMAAGLGLLIAGLAGWLALREFPGQAPTQSGTMPAPASDRPAVAVLPFHNLGDEAGQDYFSDGVTKELITALSKFSSLIVIASNTVFSYKGSEPGLAALREELRARYVIEGAVQRTPAQVRINVHLADATTGRTV